MFSKHILGNPPSKHTEIQFLALIQRLCHFYHPIIYGNKSHNINLPTIPWQYIYIIVATRTLLVESYFSHCLRSCRISTMYGSSSTSSKDDTVISIPSTKKRPAAVLEEVAQRDPKLAKRFVFRWFLILVKLKYL